MLEVECNRRRAYEDCVAEHETDEIGVVVCHCRDDLGPQEDVFEEDYEGDDLEPHVSVVGSRHCEFEWSRAEVECRIVRIKSEEIVGVRNDGDVADL